MHDRGEAVLRRATAICLLLMMALELTELFAHADWARYGSHVAMLGVIVAAIRRLGLREAYLLTLCAAIAGLLGWRHPDPWTVAFLALDQAAFLMAFILLISLVQEGAMTSQSVARAGNYLARQPGSRRYLALFTGTHFTAIVFNLGTVSLIAPLIRRAAEEAPDDPLTPIRERRQLSALLRGFAWAVIWSPTAVAPLALMELIPGVDRLVWLGYGLAIAAVILLVGWAEDWYRWRNHTAAALGLPPATRPPFPTQAYARFGLVSVAFAGITATIMLSSGQRVPASLMAASPVLLLLWLAVQRVLSKWPRGRMRQRLGEIAMISLPASAPAAVTLACSGFVGRAGAALIPPQVLADIALLDQIPDSAFLLGLSLAVTALAQLALSPIMMAVFFGAVLGAAPVLPADPTLTALAISIGWALSMTSAPFASVVLLLTRVTDKPGTLLTYRWNTVFSLLAVVAVAASFMVLTAL